MSETPMETDEAEANIPATARVVRIHDFLEMTAQGITVHPLVRDIQPTGISREAGQILLRTLGPRPHLSTAQPSGSKAEAIAAGCNISVDQLGTIALFLPISAANGDFLMLSPGLQQVIAFHAAIFMGQGLEPATCGFAPGPAGRYGRITLKVFMQRVCSGAVDERRTLVDWLAHVRPEWREVCARACLSQVIRSSLVGAAVKNYGRRAQPSPSPSGFRDLRPGGL